MGYFNEKKCFNPSRLSLSRVWLRMRLILVVLHPKKVKQKRFVVTYTDTEKLPAYRKVNSPTVCLLGCVCVCVCLRKMGLYWRGSGRTAATQQCCSSSGGPGRRRGCRWWRGGWGADSEGWCVLHAGPKAFGRWAPAGSAKPQRLGLNQSLLAKVVCQDDPAENTPPPRTDIAQFAAGYEALNRPSHTPKETKNSRYYMLLSWFWVCLCVLSFFLSTLGFYVDIEYCEKRWCCNMLHEN